MTTLEQYIRQALDQALAKMKDRVAYAAPETADQLWIDISGEAVLAGVRRWFAEQLGQVAEQAPGISVDLDRTQLLDTIHRTEQDMTNVIALPPPILAEQVTQAIAAELHCSACGLIQPLIALRPYRPDGAHDAEDYVCRDWQACGWRVADQHGRHSR